MIRVREYKCVEEFQADANKQKDSGFEISEWKPIYYSNVEGQTFLRIIVVYKM
jgi:hypothetical protein